MYEDNNNPENNYEPYYEQNNFHNSSPDQQPIPVKKKKGWTAGKVIALALCCSLVGGALGASGAYWMSHGSNSSKADTQYLMGHRENVTLNPAVVETGKKMTASEVYAQNVNSTVGITTSITTNFWGYQTTSAASGSGFVLTPDGYILTNYHVIENSSSITVSLYDGTTYDAVLVGYDIGNDIAVLKVDAKDLVPVVIGKSDELHVGDDVVAIGNPLGELTFSLTAGAVSALNREVVISSGNAMNLIQTDCAINSGNSGGALFNMYGEVVGITNAKYSGNSGSGASIDNIAFAIPIDDVWDIIQSIIEKGFISKPYIGVSVTDVNADALAYGLPQGAAVRSVTADSPAAEAGLQEVDIITAIDDKPVTGSKDLVAIVKDSTPGDVLTLSVFRKGESMKLTLKVGEQVISANENNPNAAPNS